MFQTIDEKILFEFMFEFQITQTELAKRAKVTRATIHNFLYCKHKPSFYVQSCLYRAMKEIREEYKKKNKK